MSKKKNSEDHQEFVTVLFARNLAEAEFYKALLEDQEIPVLIEDENTEAMGLPDMARGVPVMVPEEQLELAQDIIEQRTALDDDIEDNGEDEEDEDEEEDEFEDMEELDLEEAEEEEFDDEEEEEDEDEDEEER
ncbi:MAG: hypothetical protein BWY71_01418 [Planctomycetes bacterium ADurb.Bin412]|nr:MAG: hypothetical protein BWY71_01418 [Planctomycetes bacterium ADurb.Bin412]